MGYAVIFAFRVTFHLTSTNLLQKYRYRWLIENGLKDLVYSYFLDEIYSSDPQRVEFEFYCAMVAMLTYEYFLKGLGGEHFRHQDGNKTTLQKMRNLFFKKRNFTLEQNSDNNFILTILDTSGNDLEQRVASMLAERMEQGKNKVLWWGNRGLVLRFNNQYKSQKVSGQGHEKVSEIRGGNHLIYSFQSCIRRSNTIL